MVLGLCAVLVPHYRRTVAVFNCVREPPASANLCFVDSCYSCQVCTVRIEIGGAFITKADKFNNISGPSLNLG